MSPRVKEEARRQTSSYQIPSRPLVPCPTIHVQPRIMRAHLPSSVQWMPAQIRPDSEQSPTHCSAPIRHSAKPQPSSLTTRH